MITLILLHPGNTVPVQNWTFETESTIRVGRSLDNDVILYSAVVSRHHIEIRRQGKEWEVVNLGANGTYVNDKSIAKTRVIDGMIIRLASSGPKIQIHLEPEQSPVKRKLAELAKSLAISAEEESNPSKETIIN